jgi:hypothetical protein
VSVGAVSQTRKLMHQSRNHTRYINHTRTLDRVRKATPSDVALRVPAATNVPTDMFCVECVTDVRVRWCCDDDGCAHAVMPRVM